MFMQNFIKLQRFSYRVDREIKT